MAAMFETKSPFERLRELIGDTPPGAAPIDLSVGNPRHPPPDVLPAIAEEVASFASYPPIAGTPRLREAIFGYLERRYDAGWLRDVGDILPLSGSREGLFFSAITARDLLKKSRPAILFANPFYQAYPAAAYAIGAQAVPVPACGVRPDLTAVPTETLDRAIAYYFASPSNPDGSCASSADWHYLIDLAERHNYFLFADECYGDLYRETAGPPTGVLEALRGRPEALGRVLSFNSLSKRSNLAGLRAGTVAGGSAVIAAMRDFRNQAAPQIPGPLQAAAAAAYEDDAHVAANRRLYDEKFAVADKTLAPLFGPIVPPAGFFLWLPLGSRFGGDDVAATLSLWRDAGVRAVPGRYLALTPTGQKNPGRGFVRLALVADAAVTREALHRARHVFERGTDCVVSQPTSVGSGP